MKKILIIIMLLFCAGIGCGQSVHVVTESEQNAGDENKPKDYFITEHYSEYCRTYWNQEPQQLMNRGLELYHAGKNAEARTLMIAAICLLKERNKDYYSNNEYNDKYYYLGNVCMNLREYANAEYCYIISRDATYDVDSQFNLACAYAMQKEYHKTENALLEGYVDYKDRNLARIESDPDLEGFRTSENYSFYKKALSEIIPGHEPVDGEEIRAYLSGKTFSSCAMGFGEIYFSEDGTIYIEGGASIKDAGYWIVDNDKEVLILRIVGEAYVYNNKNNIVEEWPSFKPESVREDIIPFSEIRIDEMSWAFNRFIVMFGERRRVRKIVLGNARKNNVIDYDPAIAVEE